MEKTLPRGLRNNNPLNIRIGNSWVGEVTFPTDKEFEQFTSIEFGLRAGFILLYRYMTRYKLNTINEIIPRWAPSNENNTEAYIKSVVRFSRLLRHQALSFEDKDTMCRLVSAMVLVECGRAIPMNSIVQGYELACKSYTLLQQ